MGVWCLGWLEGLVLWRFNSVIQWWEDSCSWQIDGQTDRHMGMSIKKP